MVKTTHANVGQTSVKKKKNKKNNKYKRVYCILCRTRHLKQETQNHVHSMPHHREIETALGKDSQHDCHACMASSMGLKEFEQHISTAQHKANLKILASRKVQPFWLSEALGEEALTRILERNKALKKDWKKAKKKKRKKQPACQKRAEMQQGANRKDTVVSKIENLTKSRQENLRIQQQVTYQQGRNNAVVQNKENNVSRQQRRFQQRESALQNQSGKLAYFSVVGDQYAQSAQQPIYDNNLTAESSQTDIYFRRPHGPQGGTSTKPQTSWPQISQCDYYNKQYDVDFTSDHLPQNGAIVFGHGLNESTRTSQPGPELSAQPASANAVAAPIRDVDVSSMLRQIRRALGMREPCRADREARKQNSQAGDHGSAQHTGVRKELSTRGSYTKEAAAPKPQQETPGWTQHCERSSMFTGDSNGPSNSRDSQRPLHSQTSPGQCLTSPSEPNLSTPRKVRIAHEPAKAHPGKEAVLKSTLNKLLSLSGAKSKVNLKDMHQEMKRKKQERLSSTPRFGIKLKNYLHGQESSTQIEERDTTLSEGFHWESVPGSPAIVADYVEVPPPPWDTMLNGLSTDSQSGSQMQEPVEQPEAAQEGCSRQSVEVVSVKTEPVQEGKYEDLRANSSAIKRKQKVHEVISENESNGKKKKTKSNRADQDQMDQLLAVSLREDELSHSLQDVDKSLIQARSVLQAAYADVQRLLLLRQQFTAEVNSLRAQRIEILQGMKAASSSSADAAAAPRLSPLPAFPTSSSQQPSPTNRTPSISPLALPTMPVKKETLQASSPDQTSQSAKTAPFKSETLQVPVNQPLPLFPSDLLPPLLLHQPHLTAPPAAVPALRPPRTDSSPPENTNNLPESPASPHTVSSVREEAQIVDSDSEVETGGSQAKEAESAAAAKPASKSVPESPNVPSAPPEDTRGKEHDASVRVRDSPDLVIIDIAESEDEDTANVPVQQEPPQKAVKVESSSAGTQTVQPDERKFKPTFVPKKDPEDSPEGVMVVEDKEPSVGSFENHTGPVHGLQVHKGQLYTCSGDNTARAYSLTNRECLAVFEGHTNKVNCLLVSSLPNMPARLYTGSSDQTIRCYSAKTTKCLDQISLPDRVLCLHMDWNILYAGLANGSVASHDVKTRKQLEVFECHGPRGVSCLGTAQEGARRVLLVGSYDSTISVRDAKSGLLLRSLQGHTKTVLCLKVVNDLVFSGSSDTSVHAHNIHTGELIRIYKGHNHAVTSIVILGKVMVTACLDKLIRVYELQSHDRLQVYGGHSDMVMCMSVYKSMIYTGCYDGSIQAVQLNLMKNYRCWWQNCTLIFGMAEHLMQHLVSNHSNPNLEAVKCRWRGCSSFFATQESVRQKLPDHMQRHVEKDSKVEP